MSYGLRVWSASGAMLVDISDRLVRAHGTYDIGIVSAKSTKTISVPGLNISDGTWFYIVEKGSMYFNINAISEGFTIYNSHTQSISSTGKIYVIRG